MTNRAVLGFIATLILGLGSGVAAAGESGTLSGTGGGSGPPTTITLGNGDTILLVSGSQVIDDDTPNGKVFYAGECVGMVTLKADETYIGGDGYCTWHESETDAWDVRWYESGPEGGTFEIVGGSGKWKGVNAKGGTYAYTYNDGDKFRYTYSIDYTIK